MEGRKEKEKKGKISHQPLKGNQHTAFLQRLFILPLM